MGGRWVEVAKSFPKKKLGVMGGRKKSHTKFVASKKKKKKTELGKKI
jgi:hypothetical protein